MIKRRLRYGLIGAGRISVQHLQASRLLRDEMEITAICDTDDAALKARADEYGIPKRYSNIQDLLTDSDVDVVTILTPPHIRSQVVIPCLEAGKHVFVEKPFALTMPEAVEMVTAADRTRCYLAVNQNYRWRPEARLLKELLDGGDIGKVRMYNLNQSFWRDETDGWRNTTDYLAVSVMGVHWLDRFRWLIQDEAKSVYACFGTSGLLSSKGEDVASVIVHFREGAVATLTHNWISRVRSGEADYSEIVGTKGSILVQGPKIRLYQADRPDVREWQAYRADEGYKIFVESFAESIRVFNAGIVSRTECAISGRDNLFTMGLVDASYQSSASGEPVRL